MVALVAAPGRESSLDWAVLSVGLILTELGVVHLRLGRSAFSFTLGETVLVLGALRANPLDLLIGVLVGPALVMIFVHHLAPLKIAFNLGQYVLSASILVLATTWLGLSEGIGGALGVLATTAVVGVLTMVLIAIALLLADGTAIRRTLVTAAGGSILVSALSASLGFALAVVAAQRTADVWLMLPAAAAAGIGVRARRRSAQQAAVLDALINEPPSADVHPSRAAVLESMTSEASKAVGADVAWVLDLGDEPRLGRWSAQEGASWAPASAELVGAVLPRATSGSGGVVEAVTAELLPAELGRGLPMRTTVAAVTSTGQARPHAVLCLFDDAGSSYSMLDNGAAVVGSIVDRSADRLDAIFYRQRWSTLVASIATDPSTGLPTRAALQQWLGDSRSSSCALLLIRIDGLDEVHDLLGDGGRAAALAALAVRISSLSRPGDLVARVGTSEFALLVEDVTDPFAIEAFGTRVELRVGAELHVPEIGVPVRVRCDVGVGMAMGNVGSANGPGVSLDDLERLALGHLQRRRVRGRYDLLRGQGSAGG